MEVGQPAYPCAEIGGVILTYVGTGETPDLPVHEFLVNPAACVALTKVFRADNFLQGVLSADEPPLDGAKFIAPNLVAYPESPSGGEICVRWHAPVDDTSHVEFTFRYLGKPPITSDPVGAADRVLLKAMEEISLSGQSRGDQP